MSAIVALRQNNEISRDAFLKINKKHGHITPALVVKEAANPDSELHDLFCWEDAEAGHNYRLMQARFLIRTVKLEIVRQEHASKEIKIETTRAFVSPPSMRGAQSYVTLKKAMDDVAIKTELLDRAKIELRGIKNRYKQLQELSEVWDVIEMI